MCAVARLGHGSRHDEGPSAGAGRDTGSARIAGRDPCSSTSSGRTGCGLDGSPDAATRCRPRRLSAELGAGLARWRGAADAPASLARDRRDTGVLGRIRSRRRGPVSSSGWRRNRTGPRRSSSTVCGGSTRGCFSRASSGLCSAASRTGAVSPPVVSCLPIRSERPKALLRHRAQTPIRTTWLPTQRHRSRSGRSGPCDQGLAAGQPGSLATRFGSDSGRSAPCVRPETPGAYQRENVRSDRDVSPRSVQFSVAIDTEHAACRGVLPVQGEPPGGRFLAVGAAGSRFVRDSGYDHSEDGG